MRLLRRRPATPVDDRAEWALEEREHEGRPMLVRRNVTLAARAGDSGHDHLLVVTVEEDLGDPEVLARLGGFEEALVGILGADDLCWAAGIVTVGDARQFLFYTPGGDAVAERLAFVRDGFPQAFRPALRPDPEWAAYARLAGAQ